jgi:hypothetical protein
MNNADLYMVMNIIYQKYNEYKFRLNSLGFNSYNDKIIKESMHLKEMFETTSNLALTCKSWRMVFPNGIHTNMKFMRRLEAYTFGKYLGWNNLKLDNWKRWTYEGYCIGNGPIPIKCYHYSHIKELHYHITHDTYYI